MFFQFFTIFPKVSHHPVLNLKHLEQRLRNSGHWTSETLPTRGIFLDMMWDAIENLDIDQARKDIEPIIRDKEELAVWSKGFFRDLVDRILIKTDI